MTPLRRWILTRLVDCTVDLALETVPVIWGELSALCGEDEDRFPDEDVIQDLIALSVSANFSVTRRFICESAVATADKNMPRAASNLGLGKSTLYRWFDEWGLEDAAIKEDPIHE